jgi:NitT/TauT family transport system ATP-binding protein
MLQVDRLSASYQTQILKDLSFTVQPGELISIIGKSGSGKSTLLNKICEGDLRIKHPESLAFVPQQDLLLDWRTALQNVLLPQELKGKVSRASIDAAIEILTDLGLRKALGKFPNELSGGMRQRTSLARGIHQNAELYLFDEPFSAIDYDQRIQIGKLVREFIVSNNKIGVLVTHNIEEAIALSSRVLVLGGSPAKIIHEEKVSFTEIQRDPISIRSQADFSGLFARLWSAIQT